MPAIASPPPAEFTDVHGETYEVRVSQRRRYGRTTYSWLHAERKSDRKNVTGLTDPIPGTRPSRSEMLWLLRAAGIHIIPAARDLAWIRRIIRSRRCFPINPEDIANYRLEA